MERREKAAELDASAEESINVANEAVYAAQAARGCGFCGLDSHTKEECYAHLRRGPGSARGAAGPRPDVRHLRDQMRAGNGSFQRGPPAQARSWRGGGPADGPALCYNCGAPGHFSRECKEAPVRTLQSCFKCGVKGHLARNCDKTDKDPVTIGTTIDICNAYFDATGQSVDARITAEVQGVPEYYNANLESFEWCGKIMLCTALCDDTREYEGLQCRSAESMPHAHEHRLWVFTITIARGLVT